MDTVVLKVSGMSCESCAASVTRVLEALPGVTKAVVSLQDRQASIHFEAAVVGREQLVVAIDDAGFEAS